MDRHSFKICQQSSRCIFTKNYIFLKLCTLRHFFLWCMECCSTTANTQVITKITSVRTSYIVHVQWIKICTFILQLTSITRHWFRSWTNVCRSITKHLSKWKWLRWIDLNDLFDNDLERETHFEVDELGTFVRTCLSSLISTTIQSRE